jgi:hypothetical protein
LGQTWELAIIRDKTRLNNISETDIRPLFRKASKTDPAMGLEKVKLAKVHPL